LKNTQAIQLAMQYQAREERIGFISRFGRLLPIKLIDIGTSAGVGTAGSVDVSDEMIAGREQLRVYIDEKEADFA
jgi:hypothetical protein